MQVLIDVYKMEELLPSTRKLLITKLGKALNYEQCNNYTDEVVKELIILLSYKEA